MNAERILPAQWFEPGNVRSNYFDLMNNFKLGFALVGCYLGVCLFAVVVSFCLNELKHKIEFDVSRVRRRIRIRKWVALALGRFGIMNRSSTVGILVLFFNLFTWFTTLILINNIKVSYFEVNPLTNPLTNSLTTDFIHL